MVVHDATILTLSGDKSVELSQMVPCAHELDHPRATGLFLPFDEAMHGKIIRAILTENYRLTARIILFGDTE